MRKPVRARLLLAAAGLALAGTAWAQTARLPADAVDGFRAALKRKDTGGALSYLDRSLVVFEFGVTDATVEDVRSFVEPGDDVAAQTSSSARVGSASVSGADAARVLAAARTLAAGIDVVTRKAGARA